MTTRFVGSYEDRAKVVAAAREKGCPEDGGCLDYVEARDYRTERSFPTKGEAVAWVQAAITGDRTFFGVGEVTEMEDVSREDRCDACVCGGLRSVSRYVVSDIGIESEDADDDQCYREEV
jgi:hypothetical protein